jgi:hypothetical protein
MRISVLTTITNPERRQDKWYEALSCYLDFADEVVVVDGSQEHCCKSAIFDNSRLNTGKVELNFIFLEWPHEWNWVELPRHLNAGRKQCTGDWIIRLDIDQLFHEKDFDKIRQKLAECPSDCQVATFQKMSLVYGKKYYQKGGQPIAFRNLPEIVIGRNLDRETDLCFAIKKTGDELVGDYKLPVGVDLPSFKTGIQYWNHDYFFKTEDFVRSEFWRFSRAHNRYFGSWRFGDNKEASFKVFLNMMKGRHDRAPYTLKTGDCPKYIEEAVRNLRPGQFGYSGFGMLETSDENS